MHQLYSYSLKKPSRIRKLSTNYTKKAVSFRNYEILSEILTSIKTLKNSNFLDKTGQVGVLAPRYSQTGFMADCKARC